MCTLKYFKTASQLKIFTQIVKLDSPRSCNSVYSMIAKLVVVLLMTFGG